MNMLWEDIHSQAVNLRKVIGHLYGSEREPLERAANFLRNERPILFTGIASAAHLCFPAEVYQNESGRSASVVYASDALYSYLPVLAQSNVVINTRSGETAEIVLLGKALVERGIPFVAITNEPDSTLARLATYVIGCDSRKDDLVSINIITAMMTATLLLSVAVLGQMDALRDVVDSLPEKMEETIRLADQSADEIWRFFKDIRPIHLLYRGAMKGAAYCGRLVLEEVARMPATVIEAAEFRQGPNEVVDDRFGAVIFSPGGRPGSLNGSLANDILRSGGRVWMIGNPPSQNNSSIKNFPLGEISDSLLPVLGVIPLQVLAYKLAMGQGYTPGEVRYISKVITAEEGIPNERC